MMLQRRRHRIAINIASVDQPIDVITSQNPAMWRANDAQWELGCFYGSEPLSLVNVASVTLTIKSTRDSQTVLLSQTVGTESITPTITIDQWNANNSQHILIPLSSAQTSFTLGETGDTTFWFILTALTSDSPALEFTLGAGNMRVVEDGKLAGGTPPVVSDAFYTRDQADARYLQKSGDGASFRSVNGHLYLYNPDDGLWYCQIPRTINNIVTTTWSEGIAL